jgi:transposase
MSSALVETVISDEQRAILERWVGAQKTRQSVALRARIVLAAAEGESNSAIARALGVSRPTVIVWRSRFAEGGTAALTETKPGRGRKPTIAAAKVKAIVQATTQTKPPGQTHWSCRSMAKAQGVSPATVQRIWDAHGLKPHRVKTFKALDRPALQREAHRRRWPIPQPARQGDRALRRREKLDPGTRPHPAEPADEAGPRRHG